MEIRFDWNAEKAKRNLRKHGVSFKQASEAFLDPHVLIVEDCEVDGELRYQATGRTASGDLLILTVFVYRADESNKSSDDTEIIRIISARKANSYEHTAYTDQFA